MKYHASPTGNLFHASPKLVRGYKGPVGNGKTVACMQELRQMAHEQAPNSEGVRLTRAIIVRNTSLELRTTTLKTWEDWFDEKICPITRHPFINGLYRCKIPTQADDPWFKYFPDGTTVEMEVIFLAMDKPGDERKLLGIEPTFIMYNEAREIGYEKIIRGRERLGRYPAPVNGYRDVYDDKGKLIYDAVKRLDKDGNIEYEIDPDTGEIVEEDGRPVPIYEPVTRYAMVMDTNPPDDEHFWYQLAVQGYLTGSKTIERDKKLIAETFDFFDAPSPLIEQSDGTYVENPHAENIANLPGGYEYYLNMLAGNTPEHFRVMAMGQYGALFDGKRVYNQYFDLIHCPEKGVEAIPGVPLCLGWDFGRSVACIIAQHVNGQMRVLAELYSDESTTKIFARDHVKPYLQQHYSNYTIGLSVGDPSGSALRGEEGKSHIGILNDQHLLVDEDQDYKEPPLDMGFLTREAPGHNDITLRIDAVEGFMSNLREGNPCIVIDRSCKRLRKGFLGGYHYKKVQGSDGNWKEKPNKNHYSHSHDALQYVALGIKGGLVQDVYYLDDDEEDEYMPEPDNAMGY